MTVALSTHHDAVRSTPECQIQVAIVQTHNRRECRKIGRVVINLNISQFVHARCQLLRVHSNNAEQYQ